MPAAVTDTQPLRVWTLTPREELIIRSVRSLEMEVKNYLVTFISLDTAYFTVVAPSVRAGVVSWTALKWEDEAVMQLTKPDKQNELQIQLEPVVPCSQNNMWLLLCA